MQYRYESNIGLYVEADAADKQQKH